MKAAVIDSHGQEHAVEHAVVGEPPACRIDGLEILPRADGSALLIAAGRPLGVFVSPQIAAETFRFLGGAA